MNVLGFLVNAMTRARASKWQFAIQLLDAKILIGINV
jgi:hypothetical protein